jgi:alpha-1,3-glucosyltransferase
LFLVRIEPCLSPLTRVRREAKWVDDRPLSDMSDRRAPSEGIGSGEPPPRWTKNLPNAPTVRALVLVTALKLLMVPCYRSTDFEVHRNWLALTHSLPPGEWYTENTSQWTLDYPPLFAWFERALASVAARVDPGMLTISVEPYESFATVVFQRCTVMAADLVLFCGVLYQTSPSMLGPSSRCGISSRALALTLVAFSPALLMVDHVHFQYNGMVIGLHVCALAAAHAQRPVLAAVLFSVLVHTKHIFAFAAPAMAAHLLAHHAVAEWRWVGSINRAEAWWRVVAFATSAVVVTAVSFYPIWRAGTMGAMLTRLFPFGRGLSHAYWAPNFWALYNFADKCALALVRRVGLGTYFPAPVGYMTGGMTGHGGTGTQTHAVLPTITPKIALFAVLVSMGPGLVEHVTTRWPKDRSTSSRGWQLERHIHLLRLTAHVTLCSFMFGWHVHEKASLMVTVPMAIALALDDANLAGEDGARRFAFHAGEYIFVSTVANYAVSPLLFQPREWPIKTLMQVIGLVVTRGLLRLKARRKDVDASSPVVLLGQFQWAYLLIGLPALEVYGTWGHGVLFGTGRMEFLPLMLVSVYCAVGVSAAFVVQLCGYRGRDVFRAYVWNGQ